MANDIGNNKGFNGNKVSKNPSSASSGNFSFKGFNQLITNSETSAQMAANMIVGSESINVTVDSMARGAQYLDDIWKGDTKETFMEELNELNNLIKENSDTLKELGNEIERQNFITKKHHQESTKEAYDIYGKQI